MRRKPTLNLKQAWAENYFSCCEILSFFFFNLTPSAKSEGLSAVEIDPAFPEERGKTPLFPLFLRGDREAGRKGAGREDRNQGPLLRGPLGGARWSAQEREGHLWPSFSPKPTLPRRSLL